MNNKDYNEDFVEENGNYQNKCIICNSLFLGHKRRVVCKEHSSIEKENEKKKI